MPSVSDKQARFMRWAASSQMNAARAGIKQSVAQEFVAADQEKAKRESVSSKITKRYGKKK